MPKAPDFIDIYPPEPNLAEPSRELEPEFEPNSTQTLPEFPCTRVEAGKALGVSDVSIGKWIKKIGEAGVTILEGDRITADGFQILSNYQQAKNKTAFLSQLEPTQPTPQPSSALTIRRDSTIQLATDFDALYEEMATAYFSLDEAETQTTQRLEVLEAEIVQSNQALTQSQQQEDAIAQRAAVMRGIEKAMGEFSAEQKAYAATLNRLRREGKFHASVEEFRS